MVFRVLADLVVVVHLGFILFVALGAVLAWRWRRLLRWHLPAVVWGLGIVTVGFTCPLTPLEKDLRGRAGEQGYEGGFVDRYIEGVIYPGSLTRLVQALIVVAVLVGYAGVLARRPHAVSREHRDLRRAPYRQWDGDRSPMGDRV